MHGGRREGAGRRKGSKGVRTVAAAEIVVEAQRRFPDYNPICALVALASAKDTDPALAKDCHSAVLPYMAPKFRPIEADVERLIELERRIQQVRSESHFDALAKNPHLAGIAERMDRASARLAARPIHEEALRPEIDAVAEPPSASGTGPDPDYVKDIERRLAAAELRLAVTGNDDEGASGASASDPAPAPQPAAYQPFTSAPEPVRYGGVMADDYDPYNAKDRR